MTGLGMTGRVVEGSGNWVPANRRRVVVVFGVFGLALGLGK
jgi:hypothetical protein